MLFCVEFVVRFVGFFLYFFFILQRFTILVLSGWLGVPYTTAVSGGDLSRLSRRHGFKVGAVVEAHRGRKEIALGVGEAIKHGFGEIRVP